MPGGLHKFRLVALRLRQAIVLRVLIYVCCLYALMLYLDQEIMCHERVDSWIVVNT